MRNSVPVGRYDEFGDGGMEKRAVPVLRVRMTPAAQGAMIAFATVAIMMAAAASISGGVIMDKFFLRRNVGDLHGVHLTGDSSADTFSASNATSASFQVACPHPRPALVRRSSPPERKRE